MKNINRKFKKLMRNPKLFFKDMYQKRIIHLKQNNIIKHKGYNQYTVVSAVYNVAPYLDDYFTSLTKQTLSFKDHIHLILVDDGSTDYSAKIIKKWQKKFPKNIHYIYKKNGGIASARNLGLQNVKTKWVTFIDSDDFVHPDYFKIIDDSLHHHKDDSIKLVVGNLKFFFEENQLVQDTHSLRYRFEKDENIVPLNNLDKNINLFVTVSFFQTDILHKNNIIFDDKIKPNFEDGKFLADYFLYTETGNVIYLKKAIFFYRKRGDGSSTIDGAWSKKGKFSDVFSFGYIPMLRAYKNKYGTIPKNIQWTVLYELGWHLKTLLNSDFKLETILNNDEIEQYHKLFCETLSYIDSKNIIDFDLIGIWFLYKVGMMGLKGEKLPFNIAYIENVDREKQQILISYFYTSDGHDISFRLDNKDIIPKHYKILNYAFAKKVFVYEVRAWIPYEHINSQFTISIANKPTRLSLFGRQHQGWKISDILARFQPSIQYKTDGSWIIMDRDTQADDNAEHFYRYMKRNHPEQKCYFALNKSSHDWQRLKDEGFSLLNFGSQEYEIKLKKASKIISSHFDEYVQDYFNDEYEHSKKFVFLQHGVIQNDLSRFMNRKRNMLVFITSTQNEYNSIAQNHSPYKVGEKEVILAGLARHDSLLKGNIKNSKIILIMPTWRSSIIGKATKTGNARTFNKDFMQTRYAKHWASLLCSLELKNLAEQYGYKVIFAPHANIEPYLHLFKLPKYIQTWCAKNSKMSIQKLFQTSALMITDYSSVSFEMGFLEKPVLYYQFDRDEIFSGTHVIRRGYFDYERDGFGPVSENEEDLLNNLKNILENGGMSLEPYSTRSRNTFSYRDGRNCERTYQAILNMDKLDNSLNIGILEFLTEKSYANSSWQLLEERSYKLKQLSQLEKYQQYYYLSLFKQNKLVYLSQCLQKDQKNSDYWEAKIGLQLNNLDNSLAYFEKNPSKYLDDKLLCLIYSAVQGNSVQNKKFKDDLMDINNNEFVLNFIRLSEFLMQNQIDGFVKLLDELCDLWSNEIKGEYKLELLAAQLLASRRDIKRANIYLGRYWKHTKNDPSYFLTAADVSFKANNHERVVSEISQGFKDCFKILPRKELKKYAHSFRELANKLEILK